jgi:citrate synthase
MNTTRHFWRTQPLNPAETILLDMVREAHIASCARPNASREAFVTAASLSGSYVNGIIGALATLGGYHAPIVQTVWLLEQPEPAAVARQILAEGKRVPGWGNAFERGHKDPLWLTVDKWLELNFPAMAATLAAVTVALHAAGKDLYPNPSAYTAAAACLVGLPGPAAAYLFVSARLDGWTQLHLKP